MANVEMTNEEAQKLHAAARAVRKHLSRIHHDLNNPLSIISGNVQLVQELSKALGVLEDLAPPLADMEAAVEQLGATAEELVVLRNLLAQLDSEES